jgi:hypothetical protein
LAYWLLPEPGFSVSHAVSNSIAAEAGKLIKYFFITIPDSHVVTTQWEYNRITGKMQLFTV